MTAVKVTNDQTVSCSLDVLNHSMISASIANASCPFGTPYDGCRQVCYKGYEVYRFDYVMQQKSSLITYGQIYPVLVSITVVANIFVAIVLSRKNMRSPTNTILLYMSIADLGVALVPFPFIFFYHLLGNYRHPSRIKKWWCYMAMYTTESIPPFCHNTAIWLTVLLAAQRFIYIQFPVSASIYFNRKTVQKAASIIVLISALVAFPKFMDIVHFELLKIQYYNSMNQTVQAEFKCIFQYSRLVKVVGLDAYFSTYYWVRVIFFVMIPSILLVILSLLLILGIRKARQRRKRILRDTRRSEPDTSREKQSINLMLVIIVTLFLAVNLPQGVVLALICFRQVITGIHLNAKMVLLITNIDNMLILATYPINFAIYCGMSAQFRQTFKELFKRKRAASLSTPMTPATTRQCDIINSPNNQKHECTALIGPSPDQDLRSNGGTHSVCLIMANEAV